MTNVEIDLEWFRTRDRLCGTVIADQMAQLQWMTQKDSRIEVDSLLRRVDSIEGILHDRIVEAIGGVAP